MNNFLVEKAKAGTISFNNLNKTIGDIIGGVNKPDHDVNDVYLAVTRIINFLLTFAAVLAFFMILYASIQYLTSYGDDSKIESAKKTMIWAIGGIFFIAFSKAIIYIIQKTF